MRIDARILGLLGAMALVGCGGGSTSGDDQMTGDDDDDTIDGGDGSHDAAPAPDAPSGPFGCAGAALPSTAPASLTITGTVSTVGLNGVEMIDGATIRTFRRSGGNAMATATTGGDGSYTLSVDTGGTPIDGYVRASANSYLDTDLFPPAPLAASSDAGVFVMLNQFGLDYAANLAGIQLEDDTAVIGILVLDCDGTALAGATVSSNRGGDIAYVRDMMPDPDATATGPDGLAFIFNVPFGDVVVDASVAGHDLHEHTVKTRDGAITSTVVAP